MSIYDVGQIIGFIYLALFIISFQFKDKKPLMQMRSVSKIVAFIHYWMIGAYAGLVSQFFGIFPNYFAYKYENCTKQERAITIIIFTLIFIVFGIYAYKNVFDLLPIIGSIITLFSLFMKGTIYVRSFQFIISPLFLIYNIVNLSYAGIITEILVLISSVIGIFRLDRKK